MNIDLEAMRGQLNDAIGRREITPDWLQRIRTLVAEVERLRGDVCECEGFLHAQDGENLRLASEVKRLTAERNDAKDWAKFWRNELGRLRGYVDGETLEAFDRTLAEQP